MDAREARAARMSKMKRPSASKVHQIGNYDMSSLRDLPLLLFQVHLLTY
jgi:hypothetical protein